MNNYKKRFLKENKTQHLVSSPYTDWLENETAKEMNKLNLKILILKTELDLLHLKQNEMLNALRSVNTYFVNLQNSCALSSPDERSWKLVSKILKSFKS